MNFEHYHIYVVEGDAQLETVRTFTAERQAAHDRRIKWCESQGGIGAIESREDMSGLLADPDAKVVDGWKPITKKGWTSPPQLSFVPDNRTKAGKLARKVMHTLKVPGGTTLASKLGPSKHAPQFIDGQMHMLMSQAYDEGDDTILDSEDEG